MLCGLLLKRERSLKLRIHAFQLFEGVLSRSVVVPGFELPDALNPETIQVILVECLDRRMELCLLTEQRLYDLPVQQYASCKIHAYHVAITIHDGHARFIWGAELKTIACRCAGWITTAWSIVAR